ncbi:hypothetical protein J8I87_29820 [Paraburkholderia sp. LEh10]|uniref:hypothetical protein n=1 Tax=Paraburkholderia sp. LEh10 TaxID=2821353 RepID=UPI001AE80B63|nr:hypothetical protein [Paraburkholderia sp. LEh10]MBP0593809.1 hypothetical protein [Paraburkholderia sp. LEh10]
MSAYVHVAQELAHIGRMISQLERMAPKDLCGPTTSVISPTYWRARIEELATGLPPVFEPQVRALLVRLDALSESRRTHDARHQASVEFTLTRQRAAHA